MGYITNQWLKGDASRVRGHFPVRVDFRPYSTGNEWAREHEVTCCLDATRGERYQQVSFTDSDFAKVLPVFLTCASDSTLCDVLVGALSKLDNAKFLEILRRSFACRPPEESD